MTTSNHYKSNLRDLFFNLFESLQIQNDTLGHGPFEAFDEGTARESLSVLERVAVAEFAPSFVEADRTPLKLDAEGNVTLPAGVKHALGKYYEGDWDMLDLPSSLGGMGAPPSVRWSAYELISGANSSVGFYMFGVVLARIIDGLATDEQRKRFVPHMIERHWGGSMVLTEPDAGSDVGEGRTKARHVADDIWEIEGVKRFITNGDFDFPENIVHLVLARPEGAGPGTKGLSMFIVPKWWVNEDGSLGERNGVYATNVEKKMGIKASATCEMTFGEKRPARGFLVGNKHDGIRQMFHVIEQARMGVGVKSIAVASTAYLNALAYARERKQGPSLDQATNKTAPRVTIIEHADVRRMLMTQKAHVEGMRALALFTAHQQDLVDIAGGHGAKEAHDLEQLNDLLLPLVKGYCSEKAYELLAIALQCFGGSGYTQDYPIEQYIRDQKIDTLYEGTTHIQALDLFFRKIARDGGKTLQALLARIRETANGAEGGADLEIERKALARAIGDVEGIFGAMMGKIPESVHHVGLQANRILFALAELVIGWLLVKQAIVALPKVATSEGRDHDFYVGKLASTRFFVENVLPELTLTRKLVEASKLDLMKVPDAAFGLERFS